MTPRSDSTPSLVKRLLWFVGLWATSVAALAVIAIGIRWVLRQ
ncbi:MAG: DUF2474 family protein [Hyphomicrobiaceae bacterium]